MRITRAAAYRQFQPFADGPYKCRGHAEEGFDSTIVMLETDAGLTGWGEMAPLGSFYAEAFAAGVRAGVAELLPKLIGADPRELDRISALMDDEMMGQGWVKSPIDMACWDLAGQGAGLPLAEFSGGRFGQAAPLYRSVSQDTPEAMAARAKKYVSEGYTRIQVKVGADPLEDVERMRAVRAAVPAHVLLVADANGAWPVDAALRFLAGMGETDFYLEQPCRSVGETARVRAVCRHPLILDESIASLEHLLEAHTRNLAEGITIKLARVGGLTKARRIRDVAVALGLRVTIEDTGGSDINTAATTHLMLSTPEALRFHTVDFMNWVTVRNADGMPRSANGQIAAPIRPGLGLRTRRETLGNPFCEVG
jgi:L-alanine-DL-glutamate epimerase-like enolase superfamily enzyme